MKGFLVFFFLFFIFTYSFSQETTFDFIDTNNSISSDLSNESEVSLIPENDLTLYNYELEFEKKKQTLLLLASQRKSPLTAVTMSFLYSGMGQFYNRDYSLGSLFFLGETAYYLLFYGIRTKFKNTYGTTVSFNAMNSTDKVLLVSAFGVYMVMKGLSVYNAYYTAVEINQEVDANLSAIKFSMTPQDINVQYHLRF